MTKAMVVVFSYLSVSVAGRHVRDSLHGEEDVLVGFMVQTGGSPDDPAAGVDAEVTLSVSSNYGVLHARTISYEQNMM